MTEQIAKMIANEEMTFTEAEDRICADCKYLVGRRTLKEDAATWRCHAKQNLVSAEKDQVTGGMVYKLVYETCYDARKDDLYNRGPGTTVESRSCGPLGQWFEKYTFEGYKQTDYPPKAKNTPSAEDLLKELE
jgi:hypothetical protein